MAAVLWIVALVLVVLTVIDPRNLWYATTAWQFKNPEANEPSEASFTLGRIVSGVGALGFGIAAAVATFSAVAPLTQDRLDSAAYAAASDLSGEYSKYGSPGVPAIEDALGRDDVEVREAGTSEEDAPFGESYGIEELYEITGVEDASIIGCLEVSYVGGLFHEGDLDVDTTYTAGACA